MIEKFAVIFSGFQSACVHTEKRSDITVKLLAMSDIV